MKRAILVLLATGLPVLPIAAAPIDPDDYPSRVKVACVGDSITYGAGVKPRETMAYPAQLGRMLGDRWEVRNFGVSGATMLRNGDKPYHKQKAYAAALAWKPDVVVIKLGTNDSKNPSEPGGGGSSNWRLKDEFAGNAKALVADFREANEKVRVFLCLPVPAFPGRWNISGDTIKDEVIPRLREVAKATKVEIIDLHAALAPHKEFFPDTVHPDARGATVIARTVRGALAGKDSRVSLPVPK